MAPQLVLFLHFSSSWVKLRLYTENQLARLPGSALKVLGQAPTHVELGCDNYFLNATTIGCNNTKNLHWPSASVLAGVTTRLKSVSPTSI